MIRLSLPRMSVCTHTHMHVGGEKKNKFSYGLPDQHRRLISASVIMCSYCSYVFFFPLGKTLLRANSGFYFDCSDFLFYFAASHKMYSVKRRVMCVKLVCVSLKPRANLGGVTDLGFKGIFKINRARIFESCSWFSPLRCSSLLLKQRVKREHVLDDTKQDQITEVLTLMTSLYGYVAVVQ